MGNAIVLWIHILAAAIFVGPQVLLFAAAVPAMRTIEDVQQRTRATRMLTTRFGWIAGAALVVLVLTGIENWLHANDEGLLNADRYFNVLQVKLTLVVVVVVLTALHGGLIGRRLLKLQEANAPEAEIAETRRWSVILSAAVLLVSVAILFCAALLGSDWSKR
jgi:putative copper resistance protein D